MLPRSARLKTLECSRLTESIDPVTTALTGKLPFYLSLAAALTFPIALAVLRLYARAVRRSMRSQAHSVTTAPRAPDAAAIDGSRTGARAATLRDLAEPSVNAAADTLLARLLAGPRRAALVYAGAGLGYGVVMATSGCWRTVCEILPVRFLFLVWVFSWPVVLTIGIVAVTTRRVKAMMTGAYFLGLMAIGGVRDVEEPRPDVAAGFSVVGLE